MARQETGNAKSEEPTLMSAHDKVQVTTAVHSDVGKVRKANEDSYYVSRNEDLLLVCDGMGGQVAGGLASRIAVETIKHIYEESTAATIQGLLHDTEHNYLPSTQRLLAGIRTANRRLFKLSCKFPSLRGMGTTVVALCFGDAFATMAHVGDSRIFRISEERILQLTQDHSWLNELIEDNEINEEQIETFVEKNVITRALGTAPTIKIDCHCEKYKKGDIYVLCTDGVHNSLAPESIKNIFDKKSRTLDSNTRRLVDKALRIDGSDNLTVAVARVDRDSVDSEYHGMATTVPQESQAIVAVADKLIENEYPETQLPHQKPQKPKQTEMKKRKFFLPGLLLLTGLLCFGMGMFVQTAKSNSGGRGTGTSRALHAPLPARSSGNDIDVTARPVSGSGIQRSTLKKNAVLAYVFFNSQEDFKRASLEQRGTVLATFNPYQAVNPRQAADKFEIFVIDGKNNVLNKTPTINLPKYRGN